MGIVFFIFGILYVASLIIFFNWLNYKRGWTTENRDSLYGEKYTLKDLILDTVIGAGLFILLWCMMPSGLGLFFGD